MLRSCTEFAGSLMEVARGRVSAVEQEAVQAHVRSCAECAWLLEEQRALQNMLNLASTEAVAEDPKITARVLAEFDRRAALRVPPKRSVRWVWAAGLAAAITLGVVWNLRPGPVPVARRDEAPFVTIPYTIPLAPEERAMVVRMRIPVTALWAAGFHVRVLDPSATIDADVVVSQDGRARAIRPLAGAIFD